MDKPHFNASLSRSRSDLGRISSLSGNPTTDEVVVPEVRRSASNHVNAMPMKKLIAQEMSKEADCKLSPKNVVAKLMGLDGLPQAYLDTASKRSKSKSHSQRSLSHEAISTQHWDSDAGGHAFQNHDGCQHVYKEFSKQKTDVVRQKFFEAKGVVRDRKLRRSKEFQDAIEVLSSNRDLFIKFLRESNSLFSQHTCDLETMSPSSEMKRITVLRPSKMTDDEKCADLWKKSDHQTEKKVPIVRKIEEYPTQSDRIVVLKPKPVNSKVIKALAASQSSCMRKFQGEENLGESDDVGETESSEVSKKITLQMERNATKLQRDENLYYSSFSNGYVGDDTLFNKSENDYEIENFSGSEFLSPASRHSWDFVNRVDSSYSSSSLSRASCSSEFSVFREAKKRLSQRWSLMASKGYHQDHKQNQTGASTLGEMLALSDKEQETEMSFSCLTASFNKEDVDGSPKGLLRSKSVPVSSTLCGTRLNVEVGDIEDSKIEVPKVLTKSKSFKLSLKQKVSSLFFSRNKKLGNDKLNASLPGDDLKFASSEKSASPENLCAQVSFDASRSDNNGQLEECLLLGARQLHKEASLSVANQTVPGNGIQIHDHPSPVSVLEPPCEDYDSIFFNSCNLIRQKPQGFLKTSSDASLSSNLIGKSPPIGSVARSLTLDNSRLETTPRPIKSDIASLDTVEEDEDWDFLVNTLLSASGLEGDVQLNDDLLIRWHSGKSPLDPFLRNNYANGMKGEEPISEKNQRKHRSKAMLVFDLVNALLLDLTTICRHGSDKNTNIALVDHVRTQTKKWLCCDHDGDTNNLVIDSGVRREVAGKLWDENMRLEMDNARKEIEDQLLQELVQELVQDSASLFLCV